MVRWGGDVEVNLCCAGAQGKKMNGIVNSSKVVLAVMLVLVAALGGCSDEEAYAVSDFVGRWQSSRVSTPIHLYENGEWEFKADDGAVQQYGVWQYSDNKILWTARVDDWIHHDWNRVLSVTPEEFQLRENDGSTTTFSRLD
jgi:hypothetical protein